MYDIRQFKPALYALLILGISGFALAARMPVLWLLAAGFIAMNGWLLAIGRFRPISRVVANIITLVSALYVGRELVNAPMTPVIVIGEFLVFLQIVKLWEQRANRDYAQLLILSLLLMVAASMNTASLGFGLMLVLYLVLSLYCCLLFHLKVETDAARAALPVPEEKISPGAHRQDQRNLSRSMRRLTGLVAVFSITSAVVVFVLFPRGSGGGLLGGMQSYRLAPPLTGFSEQVSFQDVARITQSHETVAFIKLWHGGEPVTGEPVFLRGLTLDTYRPPVAEGGPWDWKRTDAANASAVALVPGERLEIATPGANATWRQQIALWPTHTDVLFAMAGPVSFSPRQQVKLRFTPTDGSIQTVTPLNDRIDYEVISTNEPGPGEAPSRDAMSPADVRATFPRIYDFARRPDVSGSDPQGPLAARRVATQGPSPLDAAIAANIEKYLRNHFQYTLDLSDEGSVRGRDPLEAFLYDWKKGHCEYFAGAMTLMCQSLGMQARMVVGFKCGGEDYNSLNGTYTVHDSDAHAWVEVRTPQGWKGFDPTSSMEAPGNAGAGLLGRLRHVMEYLEYTYANAVIAYDSQNRDSVIATVEAGMAAAANSGSNRVDSMHDFIEHSAGFWNASTIVLTGFLLLMVAVIAAASGWFVWERWLLRRRAQRIGIESLPESEQLRLARQLGFYDDLLRLLDRHRIAPPPHYTPMEFSRSLAFLPADAYDTVQRLTALFYRVRYGGTELPAARQRRLGNVIARLNDALSGTGVDPRPEPRP